MMVAVNRVTVRRRPDGKLAVSIPISGKVRTATVDATNPVYGFLSKLEIESRDVVSPDRAVMERWLFHDHPLALSAYPEVDPVDFRFPVFEGADGQVEWWDHLSPFVTFVVGRKGSGRTSFLSGINHSLQYVNRTSIVEVKCAHKDMNELLNRLRTTREELKKMYRDNNRSTYRNPFRRKNTVILVDDFPSADYPSAMTESVYAELFDFLESLAPYREFVKVVVTTERPLPSLFYAAASDHYAVMREVPNVESLLSVARRLQLDPGTSPLEPGSDLLGWNLWAYMSTTGQETVETLVKTPEVNVKYIKMFLESEVNPAELVPDDVSPVDAAVEPEEEEG